MSGFKTIRFPSVKTIETRLGVDRLTARVIRGLMDGTKDPREFASVQAWIAQCYNEPRTQEFAMRAINEVLDGYGEEAIRGEVAWVDSFHGDVIATYVNMGDTYAGTILYDTERGTYAVCTMGDWIETYERYRGRVR